MVYGNERVLKGDFYRFWIGMTMGGASSAGKSQKVSFGDVKLKCLLDLQGMMLSRQLDI